MDIRTDKLAIAVSSLGLAIHKALTEAGSGLMEAAHSMPEGSSAQQRVYEHGARVIRINDDVGASIGEILELLSKASPP